MCSGPYGCPPGFSAENLNCAGGGIASNAATKPPKRPPIRLPIEYPTPLPVIAPVATTCAFPAGALAEAPFAANSHLSLLPLTFTIGMG
jgi:hypothetical protein